MRLSTRLSLMLGCVLIAAACGDSPRHDPTGTAPLSSAEARDGDGAVPNASGPGTLNIEIPEAIRPLARGDKYETPLSEALEAKGLGGGVVGGGSMVDADGSIMYVDVAIEVTDIDAAVEVLRSKLREIGAPKGTTIRVEDSDRAPILVW